MSFIIRSVDGRPAALLICEGCTRPITDDGNACYDLGEATEGAAVHFFHRACDQPEAGRRGWEPLATFFNHLLHNARIDPGVHDHDDCELM